MRYDERYWSMVSNGQLQKAQALFADRNKFPMKMSKAEIENLARCFNQQFPDKFPNREII